MKIDAKTHVTEFRTSRRIVAERIILGLQTKQAHASVTTSFMSAITSSSRDSRAPTTPPPGGIDRRISALQGITREMGAGSRAPFTILCSLVASTDTANPVHKIPRGDATPHAQS